MKQGNRDFIITVYIQYRQIITEAGAAPRMGMERQLDATGPLIVADRRKENKHIANGGIVERHC